MVMIINVLQKETTIDLFNCVPRRLLKYTKRVKVDSKAIAQNNENFNESTLAVDDNVRIEQTRYDEVFVDPNTLKKNLHKIKLLSFYALNLLKRGGYYQALNSKSSIINFARKKRLFTRYSMVWFD